MHEMWSSMKAEINRRSFMEGGITAAGAATVSAGIVGTASSVLAEQGPEERSGRLTPGDAALLRFAAAAETLKTDFWDQYNELGGIQDNEFPGGVGLAIRLTRPHLLCLIPIWHSMSTTTLMMNSLTNISSMPISSRRVRSL